MREEKFHIYLNDDEYGRVIQSLIRLKNSLIAQGRYTDGVDNVRKRPIRGCIEISGCCM